MPIMTKEVKLKKLYDTLYFTAKQSTIIKDSYSSLDKEREQIRMDLESKRKEIEDLQEHLNILNIQEKGYLTMENTINRQLDKSIRLCLPGKGPENEEKIESLRDGMLEFLEELKQSENKSENQLVQVKDIFSKYLN